MNMTNGELNIGDVIVFYEGKDEKSVAYCPSGKVILCRDRNMPLGYAEITSVQDKGNYFLVDAKHIVKDLYSGIAYEDFIGALAEQRYKIGFDRIFGNDRDGILHDEHQILAYNMEFGIIIVATTASDHEWERMASIEAYCPGLALGGVMHIRYFVHGSEDIAVFDFARCSGNGCDFLQNLHRIMENCSPQWPKQASISLSTYADKETLLNGEEIGTWDATICRIYAVPDVKEIMKNCTDFWYKVALLKTKGAADLVLDEAGRIRSGNTGEIN